MHAEPLAFLQRVRKEHPRLFRRSRVLECGSYDINGSPRGLFEDADYTGIDWRPGPGVDVAHLVHEYQPAQPFDVALSTEMLEHDPHWQRSVRAMIGHLAPGGALMLTWASPRRTRHEVDCAPQPDYYRGLSLQEVLDVVTGAANWHTIQGAQTSNGLDCQLLAIKPALSVIIGTVGQPALVNCCIQEVRRLATLPIEIVLVDNGSTAFESALLADVKADVLLHSDQPLGYAKANNWGIASSSGKYVMLLNNDAWPTQVGWDARLLSVIESMPDAQVVSATVSRVYHPGQLATGPVPADGCKLIETDQVAFVAALLRRSTVDAIGPLDERFGPGNFEDDDYCLRVRQTGGRIVIDPATYMFHVGSVTMRTLVDYGDLLKTNARVFAEKWSVIRETEEQADQD